MVKHDRSKEHCPDKRQIVIGLLVIHEGIPIAHKVFEGDEADKATVIEAV